MDESRCAAVLSAEDMRPDPRISNRPPGWMTWADFDAGKIAALTDDDVDWIQRHWADSGGGKADPAGWITMETIGEPLWPYVTAMGVFVAALVVYVLAVTL